MSVISVFTTNVKLSFVKTARGLIVAVLLLLCAGLSIDASADAPVTSYTWGASWVGFGYPNGQAVCDAYKQAHPASAQTSFVSTSDTAGYCQGPSWQLTDVVRSNPISACADGSSPDTSKPLGQQCGAPASNTCAGYDSPETFIQNSYVPLQNPVCTWADSQHINVSCTGSYKGKQTTVETACKSGGTNGNTGVVPSPVPSPAPPVEVDYPECAAGSYSFTDIDGSTSCATSEPPADNQRCASGNAGTVNGEWACLPPNPAPATAAAAAAAAQAKADAAKAAAGTQTAADAAKDAAVEAQKAKDASDSLPNDAATKASAQKAIDAAKQAAGYGGTIYTGPSGTGSGSGSGIGTGDITLETCGLPGKPKCQIDETATPNGNGAYDTAKTSMDTAYSDATSQLTQVTDANGKDTSWGWSPSSWFSAGSCEAFDFGEMPGLGVHMAFDICPQLAQAQQLISFIWVLSTIGVIMSMVWETMNSGGA